MQDLSHLVGTQYNPDFGKMIDEIKFIRFMHCFHEFGVSKLLLKPEEIPKGSYKKDWRRDVVAKVGNAFNLEDILFETKVAIERRDLVLKSE